jgi:hypothetical protein
MESPLSRHGSIGSGQPRLHDAIQAILATKAKLNEPRLPDLPQATVRVFCNKINGSARVGRGGIEPPTLWEKTGAQQIITTLVLAEARTRLGLPSVEIRRTAEANGGTPLGKSRFAAETGVREHDWSGRY